MIDIWMLFTMTVPFLEVALHTFTHRLAEFSLDGRVHQVQPTDQLHLKPPQQQILPAWMAVLLPIISVIFTIIFWTIGLIVSYWPNTLQDPNMADCLTIDLN